MDSAVNKSFKSEETCSVPFFRPYVGDNEIFEVVDTLNSGWLTTGPKVKHFEKKFAESVDNDFAVGLNSCTAALHLAIRALELKEGQGVLVPTMTFAATSEIVFYENGIPILVDCDPVTGNLNLEDAERKINQIRNGEFEDLIPSDIEIVGIIPVHVGGLMLDLEKVNNFAARHNLWVVEDAAHSFPAAWRENEFSNWKKCGSRETTKVTCFSFYANKTMTTGEGGMAVTNDEEIANRISLLSLHGLSKDAWMRFSKKGSWDYQIVSPGYKYNLTDIAAAIGIHQLERAESMRKEREQIAKVFTKRFSQLNEIEIPPNPPNRIHSWHLYPIRLKLEKLSINRNQFIEELKKKQIGSSVHWRPLHLHPYYDEIGWNKNDFPNANTLWSKNISLPIFQGMKDKEINSVMKAVEDICLDNKINNNGMSNKKDLEVSVVNKKSLARNH